MLTADLVRVKNYKGKITPRWIDPEDPDLLEKAQSLVDVFQSDAATKSDIDDAVESLIAGGTDFLIWRGFAKLLLDRSEFEIASEHDPVEIRRALFEATRGQAVEDDEARLTVLKQVGAQFGISPDEVATSMYADLEERLQLTDFRKITATKLLHRYNLALAQACLYKANSMEVSIRETRSARLRYLFQNLKFFGLMHTVSKDGKTLNIHIDGPTSQFSMSRKYGLGLAKFLPAVVHMKQWSVEADLDWVKGKTHQMALSHEDNLTSHYRVRGQWIPEEQTWFEERFSKKYPDWELEQFADVVDLDRGNVMVPTYRLTSPLGEVAYIEIIGFWRKDYLDRRLEWLAKTDEPLILVVAEKLKTGREKLADMPPEVVFYKSSILPDRIIEAAQNLFG